MMNIIVCVKQVPDTAATIRMDPSGNAQYIVGFIVAFIIFQDIVL
jgi:electron transfer flavoprotein alpha/beta subunit